MNENCKWSKFGADCFLRRLSASQQCDSCREYACSPGYFDKRRGGDKSWARFTDEDIEWLRGMKIGI